MDDIYSDELNSDITWTDEQYPAQMTYQQTMSCQYVFNQTQMGQQNQQPQLVYQPVQNQKDQEVNNGVLQSERHGEELPVQQQMNQQSQSVMMYTGSSMGWSTVQQTVYNSNVAYSQNFPNQQLLDHQQNYSSSTYTMTHPRPITMIYKAEAATQETTLPYVESQADFSLQQLIDISTFSPLRVNSQTAAGNYSDNESLMQPQVQPVNTTSKTVDHHLVRMIDQILFGMAPQENLTGYDQTYQPLQCNNPAQQNLTLNFENNALGVEMQVTNEAPVAAGPLMEINYSISSANNQQQPQPSTSGINKRKRRTKKKTENPVADLKLVMTADGKYKCEECNKLFNQTWYLTQHNKSFHSGERPFKCPQCGKRFADEEKCQKHQEKHVGDKPYKCLLCPKAFNHKADLKRHGLSHTGVMPFACNVCYKGFPRNDHMLKHMGKHFKKDKKNDLQNQNPNDAGPGKRNAKLDKMSALLNKIDSNKGTGFVDKNSDRINKIREVLQKLNNE